MITESALIECSLGVLWMFSKCSLSVLYQHTYIQTKHLSIRILLWKLNRKFTNYWETGRMWKASTINCPPMRATRQLAVSLETMGKMRNTYEHQRVCETAIWTSKRVSNGNRSKLLFWHWNGVERPSPSNMCTQMKSRALHCLLATICSAHSIDQTRDNLKA